VIFGLHLFIYSVYIIYIRWGKRAAHNRAQITYYLAENLELRREEFAEKISKLTGKSMDDARWPKL
jgi:acyl-CoA reductase-like NAD-dependent aldehyde dehydrogenase